MNEREIRELDKSLEIAQLIRASEAGYARDHRTGPTLGHDADLVRLEAFTLGLLDALSKRLSFRNCRLALMVYLHKLVENGPGESVRIKFGEMIQLADKQHLARYINGGRYHIERVLMGESPDVGRFARLLSEERDGY